MRRLATVIHMGLFDEGKVVIRVGVNEMQPKSINPRVRYGPEEVAAEAIECARAGAAIIHFHSRTDDGAQRSTTTAMVPALSPRDGADRARIRHHHGADEPATRQRPVARDRCSPRVVTRRRSARGCATRGRQPRRVSLRACGMGRRRATLDRHQRARVGPDGVIRGPRGDSRNDRSRPGAVLRGVRPGRHADAVGVRRGRTGCGNRYCSRSTSSAI